MINLPFSQEADLPAYKVKFYQPPPKSSPKALQRSQHYRIQRALSQRHKF